MQAPLSAKSARWPGPLRAAALLLAVASLAGYVGQAGCRTAPSQPPPVILLPATKAAPVNSPPPVEPLVAPAATPPPSLREPMMMPATKAAPLRDYLAPTQPAQQQQQAAPR